MWATMSILCGTRGRGVEVRASYRQGKYSTKSAPSPAQKQILLISVFMVCIFYFVLGGGVLGI